MLYKAGIAGQRLPTQKASLCAGENSAGGKPTHFPRRSTAHGPREARLHTVMSPVSHVSHATKARVRRMAHSRKNSLVKGTDDLVGSEHGKTCKLHQEDSSRVPLMRSVKPTPGPAVRLSQGLLHPFQPAGPSQVFLNAESRCKRGFPISSRPCRRSPRHAGKPPSFFWTEAVKETNCNPTQLRTNPRSQLREPSCKWF